MNVILDTGPWVALIDRSETLHETAVQWLRAFEGHIYTTEAVLTEVTYLLNFSIDAQAAALDFVAHSGVELVPASIASTETAQSLMKKYHDLPMDYADATIVALAVESGIDTVVTFDKRDFSLYRLPGNNSFRILPD